MLFNSIEFAIFLPLAFLIYWAIPKKSIRLQNLFLVLSSFFFYGWWDWRFLGLMVISASVDFFVGIGLSKTNITHNRRALLALSIFVNLGILCFFKYFNFFAESFSAAFTFLGGKLSPITLSVVLPIGISFYTFQALSYSIDVYRKRLQPTTDIVGYFAFISFFPQLVAGPIERATNFLPQFFKPRSFNYENGSAGVKLIIWGLFKKVVVADNCAIYVDAVFGNHESATSIQLILGVVFFAFQIYGDFSGYSDMAIGTANLFGFRLMRNFKVPYFSRDIAEFWRRWHISLTTWFRDYLYIPMGGSRGPMSQVIRNTFIIFLVSGFWHGANWTFIFWGLINALYFLPLLLTKRNGRYKTVLASGRHLPSPNDFARMFWTFFLVCIAWTFFRSPSIAFAFNYISRIFNSNAPGVKLGIGIDTIAFAISILLITEWVFRLADYPFQSWNQRPLIRYTGYAFVVLCIIFLGAFVNPQSFIYFQF